MSYTNMLARLALSYAGSESRMLCRAVARLRIVRD